MVRVFGAAYVRFFLLARGATMFRTEDRITILPYMGEAIRENSVGG